MLYTSPKTTKKNFSKNIPSAFPCVQRQNLWSLGDRWNWTNAHHVSMRQLVGKYSKLDVVTNPPTEAPSVGWLVGFFENGFFGMWNNEEFEDLWSLFEPTQKVNLIKGVLSFLQSQYKFTKLGVNICMDSQLQSTNFRFCITLRIGCMDVNESHFLWKTLPMSIPMGLTCKHARRPRGQGPSTSLSNSKPLLSKSSASGHEIWTSFTP